MTPNHERKVCSMKICLTQATQDFIAEVTRSCAGEVGGMGYCHVEGATVVVTDVFLLPQEVSAGSVDFDDDAIAIACERAAIAGKIEELRFSWHSHGKMDTFWSSVDDAAIEKYLACGTPWMASLVVNRAGKLLGRVDVANVAIAGVAQFRDVTVEVQHVDRTSGRAKAELAEHVRASPYRRFIEPGRTIMHQRPIVDDKRLHEMSDRAWHDLWDEEDDLGSVFTG